MMLQYKVNENSVEAAWLMTLYDLIEELNCKCRTFVEETYNRSYKNFIRTRIIEIYGSNTMVSWLQLRMERYDHFVNSYNKKPEISTFIDEEVS